MQYLLSVDEFERLVPKKMLDEAREAINWFHVEFIGDKCIHHKDFHGFPYCGEQCPIGKLEDHKLRNKLCKLTKQWGK